MVSVENQLLVENAPETSRDLHGDGNKSGVPEDCENNRSGRQGASRIYAASAKKEMTEKQENGNTGTEASVPFLFPHYAIEVSFFPEEWTSATWMC